MSNELHFDGDSPEKLVTKLRSTDVAVTRSLIVGDRVVLVVDCKVKSTTNDAGTDTSPSRLIRQLLVSDAFETTVAVAQALKEQRQLADDEANGRSRLPFAEDPAAPATAGTVSVIGGNLATAAEVADFLGLPPKAESVVVVLEGGERHQWPGDWVDAGDEPGDRPFAGCIVGIPGEHRMATVAELLDVRTGESIERGAAPAPNLDEDDVWVDENAPWGVDGEGRSVELLDADMDVIDAWVRTCNDVVALDHVTRLAGRDEATAYLVPAIAERREEVAAEAGPATAEGTPREKGLPVGEVRARLEQIVDVGALRRMLVDELASKPPRKRVEAAIVARLQELGGHVHVVPEPEGDDDDPAPVADPFAP